MFVFFLGCKKKENPKPPESSTLVYPVKNSECTTGNNLNALTSEVEFKWGAAVNTDTYELRATNLNTSTTQTITTSSTSAKLPLAKGAPFSWVVVSKNESVLETASSESWRFYNSGFNTSYAPFPAEIIAPEEGASILRDDNNEIELSWSGSDVDNDIVSFEIYISTENPPEELAFTTNSANATKVLVVESTIYFWRIITKDSEGNSSDSGVYDFRVL